MPADPLGVRAACRRVVEEALEVRLGSLESAVAMVREAPVPPWDSSRHYSGDHLTEYILVLDTLNFSFWGSGRGYWQLAESLRDAFNSGDPLWDGERLQALDENGLTRLIGEFPMAGLRLQALHELAALAQREAGGSIAGLVPPSAPELAGYLSTNLSSFRDVSTYGDLQVPLLKRAQIAAADLWGSGAVAFTDVDELTCFADYKLPQVLRHLGVLEYSEHLGKRVDARVELVAGAPEEVEIRAATVMAVERLRDRLAQEGRSLKAVELDWILWSRAQNSDQDGAQEKREMAPYHRVRTVFY